MIEETIQVPVSYLNITDIGKAHELQDWCEQQPGLICGIVAMAGGGYSMWVEGREANRHDFTFGDTVTWNGTQFTVTND